jgi:hypothetical protein
LLALAACSSSSGATPDAPAATADAPTPIVDAAPVDADPATQPITAPADQWTWVDFPASKCAGGTPTGMAVDPHAGSTDLVIYLEGGGSCTSATTCWGATPKANNLAGYDATTFANAEQRKYPFLDRNRAGNPFAAMNMAYIPYCTGDLHIGTIETDFTVDNATKPTFFWGARDLDLFLARLAPTFAHVQHVWIVGTSAGGFGSFLTYDHVAKAFATRVDLIDDSGPPLTVKGGSNNTATFTAWGFVAPAGCDPCTKFADVLAHDRALQPSSRFGFLSFTHDPTISADFGYTLDEYATVIEDLAASIDKDPQARSFLDTTEQSHVVMSDPALTTQYLPWLTQMVTDDPAWAATSVP